MPNLVSEVNVSVTSNPTNITVATVGLAGPSQDVSQFLTSGQIDNFTLTSGEAAAIYYTKNNESGFLSSLSGLSTGYIQNISGEINNRLTNTGQTLLNSINQITGATGLYYLLSNPAQYANSGNLTSTGATLLNLINGLSGQLDISGGNLQTQINSLANITKVTGSGTSLYLAKFAPDGSGLIPGGIIDSGNQLQFGIANQGLYSGIFYINSGGNLIFSKDNIYSIGVANKRPRHIVIGGSITSDEGGTLNGNLYIGSANVFGFGTTRTRMWSSSDGILRIENSAGTDFDRLQLGGTTSSFPSIVRSGNNIQIRAADSSKFASILAESGIFTNWVGANLPLNTSPISALDVSGDIYASGGKVLTRADMPLNVATGLGTSLYLAKFAPDGSGLVNSNIIDSGNSLQFGITNPDAPYSGVIYINPLNKVGIGTTNPSLGKLHIVGTTSNGISIDQNAGSNHLNFAVGGVNKQTIYSNSTNLAFYGASANRLILYDDGKIDFGNNFIKSTVGNIGIGTATPISKLDVSGVISSSGLTVVNNVASIGNLNLISNNDSTGIILSGAQINIYGNVMATGQITAGSGFIGDSLFSNNNLVLGTQSFTGTPSTGTFTTGIVISGTNTSIYNTLSIGAFSFSPNPGSVVFADVPLTSGSGLSGVEQSYSFQIGGTNVLKVYSENDNISGIQNTTLKINQCISLLPSGLNSTPFVLGTQPFYFYYGTNAGTWTMPILSTCTGRNYWIKNKGASLLLTGGLINAADGFFDSILSGSYTLASGQGGQFINDGINWMVFRAF